MTKVDCYESNKGPLRFRLKQDADGNVRCRISVTEPKLCTGFQNDFAGCDGVRVRTAMGDVPAMFNSGSLLVFNVPVSSCGRSFRNNDMGILSQRRFDRLGKLLLETAEIAHENKELPYASLGNFAPPHSWHTVLAYPRGLMIGCQFISWGRAVKYLRPYLEQPQQSREVKFEHNGYVATAAIPSLNEFLGRVDHFLDNAPFPIIMK